MKAVSAQIYPCGEGYRGPIVCSSSRGCSGNACVDSVSSNSRTDIELQLPKLSPGNNLYYLSMIPSVMQLFSLLKMM